MKLYRNNLGRASRMDNHTPSHGNKKLARWVMALLATTVLPVTGLANDDVAGDSTSYYSSETNMTEEGSKATSVGESANINFAIEADRLFVHIQGVKLSEIQHFTFNQQVIDDWLYDERDKGTVVIEEVVEEGKSSVMISVPLLPDVTFEDGIFGVVMLNETSISAEISPTHLRQTRGLFDRSWTCHATINLQNTSASYTPSSWRMSGTIFTDREKKCKGYIQGNLLGSAIWTQLSPLTPEQKNAICKASGTVRVDYGFDERGKSWSFTQGIGGPSCNCEKICPTGWQLDSNSKCAKNLSCSTTTLPNQSFGSNNGLYILNSSVYEWQLPTLGQCTF